MKRLALLLPAAVVVAVGAVMAWDWALGEPSPEPLSRPGSHPQLPPMDAPCEGNVITADDTLDGTLFGGAAVVLCLHTSGGALGFVVNRPTEEHARAVLPGLPWTAGRVRWGGPVSPGQGAVLYRHDGELRFSTRAPAARFPAAGWLRAPEWRDEEVLYVLAGYAGWDAQQLEGEVESGAWVLTDVDPASFLRDARAPWRRDGGSAQ